MLSVVLPFRDVEASLEDALTSTLADPACDELVLVDDGSRDGSRAIAERFAVRDRRVVLVTCEESAGVTAALRRGLLVARGDLIGRMDGDDVSHAGRLTHARDRLLADETLGAVGTRVEASPAPGPGLLRYVAWQNALITPADHARERFVEAPLCHPSVVMRRAALEAVGGYQDRPWPQDYDLWLRLVAAGWGLAKVPEVLLSWRHRQGRVTFVADSTRLARLVEARAHYLAPLLRERGVHDRFALWGAGKTGKHLARALEAHDVRPTLFVDIDPRKIGRTARGLPIVGPEDAYASGLFIVAAVGEPGARDVLRARLSAAGRVEPEAVLFAA